MIDRGSITAHRVADAATIDALARRYHQLLSAAADASAVGRQLAEKVWAPIERRVRGKRVVIVADGALQYVPFAALLTSSGEPVIAVHEVAYLPSASVLDTLRRDSRPITARTAASRAARPKPSPPRHPARFRRSTLRPRKPRC